LKKEYSHANTGWHGCPYPAHLASHEQSASDLPSTDFEACEVPDNRKCYLYRSAMKDPRFETRDETPTRYPLGHCDSGVSRAKVPHSSTTIALRIHKQWHTQ